MAESIGAVQLDLTTNTAPFKNQLNGISKTAGNMATKTFSGLGIAIAGAFSVAAITMFAKQALSLASGLAEVQNVVDVTFGSMNQQLNTWSKTMIVSAGLGEMSAKKYSSTLGAMFKSMGMGQQDVYNMSTSMTQLAGDMASFYNISTDDAFQKIQAGISGETEPLKRLGINMSVANLDAYALSKGLGKTYQAMTQANKAQLISQYLFSVTKDAQGDFLRTGSGWANQTRMLSENWKIFMTTMGSGLIGVLLPMVQGMNVLMAKIQTVAKYFQAFMSLFSKKQVASVKGVAVATTDVSDGLVATGDSAKAAGKAIKGSLASFDQLNVLSSSASDSLSAAAAAATGIGSADFGTADTSTPSLGIDTSGMESGVESLKTMLTVAGDYIYNTFGGAFKATMDLGTQVLTQTIDQWKGILVRLYNDVIVPIFTQVVTTILPMFAEMATKVIVAFTSIFKVISQGFYQLYVEGVKPALDLITTVWMDAWNSINELWYTYGDVTFKNIMTAFNSLSAIWSDIWNNVLKPIWDALLIKILEVWDVALRPFLMNLYSFAMELVNLALVIYNSFILPIVSWVVQLLGPSFSRFFIDFINSTGNVLIGLGNFLNGVFTIFRGLIQFLTGVFSGDWSKAWNGVVTVFKTIMSGIEGVLKAPINAIISLINGMVTNLNKLKIEIPWYVPVFGGQTFGVNIPKIPYLAKGGVVDSPTLAMVGERGKEAVMPLENNTGWIDNLAAKLQTAGGSNTQATGTNEYTLEIDGHAFAKLIIKLITEEQRRSGVNLLTT